MVRAFAWNAIDGIIDLWPSAATDTAPMLFFASAASWLDHYDEIGELLWYPKSTLYIPATKLSIHGRTPGKLKDPRPRPIRGFKQHRRLKNEYKGPHYR